MNLGAAASPQEAAWETLYKSLNSPNSAHRQQALNALGSIGPSNQLAVQRLEDALLNDKDPLVRQTAAAVLGQIQAKQAANALEQALDDKTAVAFTAAQALVEIGQPEPAMQTLYEVITGERKDAPGAIGTGLKYAKERLTHPKELALMGVNEASGALLGPGAIGVVAGEEALKATDPFKDKGAAGRILAATYLAQEPEPYALTLLEWALGDSNWGVRAAAAKALGQRGDASAVPQLEPLLQDDHTGARTMAAAAIIRLETGAPPLPESAARSLTSQKPRR